MPKALAIDIGGTKIYNSIVNEKGEIISEIEKHHTPKTFEEIKEIFKERENEKKSYGRNKTKNKEKCNNKF